jgi:hypothetical protein
VAILRRQGSTAKLRIACLGNASAWGQEIAVFSNLLDTHPGIAPSKPRTSLSEPNRVAHSTDYDDSRTYLASTYLTCAKFSGNIEAMIWISRSKETSFCPNTEFAHCWLSLDGRIEGLGPNEIRPEDTPRLTMIAALTYPGSAQSFSSESSS